MSVPYVDAHCHLVTSSKETADSWGTFCSPRSAVGSTRCVMSTNPYDWRKLRKLEAPGIIKSFGVHPWYCHLFSLGDEPVEKQVHYDAVLECKERQDQAALIERLPDPVPLERYIRNEFQDDLVGVIGEIGLDKLFRIPENGYYVQAEEPYRLTRVKVRLGHQMAVFRRLCQLAVQYSKPISIHNVKCHGKLFEICKEVVLEHPEINVCLHSFTGSRETIGHEWFKYFVKERIFFSLSKCINFKLPEEGRKLALDIPRSCILTETDFPIDTAETDELTIQLDYVCEQLVEAWQLTDIEECKRLVHDNFKRYLKRSGK